jgi:hypothetical protein
LTCSRMRHFSQSVSMLKLVAETKRLIMFFFVTYDIPKDKRSPK